MTKAHQEMSSKSKLYVACALFAVFVIGYMSGSAPAPKPILPIAELLNLSTTECPDVSPEAKLQLRKEIKDYEKSNKFKDKIKEAKGEGKTAVHHVAIMKYLTENVLEPKMSVLELGCAAGGVLRMVRDAFVGGIGPHGDLVGVELVTGWVTWAQSYYTDLKIFEGDITEFELPAPYSTKKFDMVMLNDVMEHIQPNRYGCFFSKLRMVTDAGSVVYMHTPTPEAQVVDAGQTLENVLPHHIVVQGMAQAGFELVAFEHDKDTKCKDKQVSSEAPRQIRGGGCYMNNYLKYTHSVFVRVSQPEVLVLH